MNRPTIRPRRPEGAAGWILLPPLRALGSAAVVSCLACVQLHGEQVARRLFAGVAVLGVCLAVGCKSDLNQQLLERELRMQEDQIYLLQDELQAKCARLERTIGENGSLKKQLGIGETDPAQGRPKMPGGLFSGQAAAGAPAALPPPMPPSAAGTTRSGPDAIRFVPPAVSIPPAGGGALPPPMPPALSPPAGLPRSAVPPPITPPTLEGVPPLPNETGRGAQAPAGLRLSFTESLAGEGKITHLVINPSRTVCFDGDGDSLSDGLALVVEPRDADERLVTAAGDITVTVHDPSVQPIAALVGQDVDAGACIARFDVPQAEAINHFRRTSRARGLHFVFRWQGPPPASGHIMVRVRMTSFDGSLHETLATVSTRPERPD